MTISICNIHSTLSLHTHTFVHFHYMTISICPTHSNTLFTFIIRPSASVLHTQTLCSLSLYDHQHLSYTHKHFVHFHYTTISICPTHTNTLFTFILQPSASVLHTHFVHFHFATISICPTHTHFCSLSLYDHQCL